MNIAISLRRLKPAAFFMVLMLLFGPSTHAAESRLPASLDLAVDAAAAAKQGMPLIVLVSLAGCPHCELVRRSYLLPLADGTPGKDKAVIRQVDVKSEERMRDFDGAPITHRQFIARYKVRIAPVVLFFDASGRQLAAPLVGSIPDFYGAYFDAALAEAKGKLKVHQPAVSP